MKIVLMTSVLTFFFSVQDVNACGVYQLEGFVRLIKNKAVILVNEKSKSEITVRAPFNWEAKLYAYMDRPVKAVIMVTKAFDGTRGELSGIEQIELRVPDPVRNPVEELQVIKPARCL